MITVESVSKSFNGKKAVDAISFQADAREVLVLLGTSGCGKTTTLKMINRLIEADSGNILINGRNIRSQKVEDVRMGIGFVMQHSGLFPHYTIQQNIAVVPDLLKWNRKKTVERTLELLHKLHLSEELLSRFPHELSGGQQQRVGIARALIADSPVLLMDEPFGALDTITKADIHAEFKSLEELKNKTIILVTHDVQEAFDLGHKICLMDKGKIIQTGTPKEMLYYPENDFVKNFFAKNRLLLEYKVTSLKDVKLLMEGSRLYDDLGLSENTAVWDALQRLSADISLSADYENLVKAFNEYRKFQTV
ncbi:ABC transporter ATP-binding protein [Chryseobacterium indologenes]|uniref:ABC transporter ATP-binding protein n=1 Tax=Chryseobacterium indologenes TaxID=253 RepID=UPI000F4F40EA|nr:ABC transporter ATP-binding protein [Chryseobacterium indologenes]AYZ35054.1 ABC transporter ATP-binding protein [Chryseobacterium indologenes]MBF6643802.1 ABC transporter ATP-binding protein [Chryseobacterium indologenes]MBU3048450.1 ABC transporter ATP-binding protein [Chryseobacterium indologenes]MEB4762860.1 ABC transporter ATP-binding protein [Chryseobacterium indologenes]QQQ72467.1 ABC transporter ATP-binding protein [Chryseobacterium indologenes]